MLSILKLCNIILCSLICVYANLYVLQTFRLRRTAVESRIFQLIGKKVNWDNKECMLNRIQINLHINETKYTFTQNLLIFIVLITVLMM